jgi:hypothetical protein
LRGAKNAKLTFARQSILPDEGDIIGWKKCRDGVIVKLLIKSSTPRSNASGRKCRAERATALEVIGAKEGISDHDSNVIYRKGKTVICHKWDDNRWEECSGGIHFYITRAEAEAN